MKGRGIMKIRKHSGKTIDRIALVPKNKKTRPPSTISREKAERKRRESGEKAHVLDKTKDIDECPQR